MRLNSEEKSIVRYNNIRRIICNFNLDPFGGSLMALGLLIILEVFLVLTCCIYPDIENKIVFFLSCMIGYVSPILIILFIVYFCCCNKPISKGFNRVSYCGINRIIEKPQKKKIADYKKKHTCEELLDEEIDTLISGIPIGRSAAITHGYVIEKIEERPQTFVILKKSHKPLYSANLRKLHDDLFGCRKCPQIKRQLCELGKNVDNTTEFYYIEFKKKEEQPNP